MQAELPTPVRHRTPGPLINYHHLFVLQDIVNASFKEFLRLQCQQDHLQPTPGAAPECRLRKAPELFSRSPACCRDIYHALDRADYVITAFSQPFRYKPCRLAGLFKVLFPLRLTDQEGGHRLIDQAIVRLVDEGTKQSLLDQFDTTVWSTGHFSEKLTPP